MLFEIKKNSSVTFSKQKHHIIIKKKKKKKKKEALLTATSCWKFAQWDPSLVRSSALMSIKLDIRLQKTINLLKVVTSIFRPVCPWVVNQVNTISKRHTQYVLKYQVSERDLKLLYTVQKQNIE